tara:strand:- start:56 stop:415 length:360 start_codon:yes stop_codon:yes gene_type:complete
MTTPEKVTTKSNDPKIRDAIKIMVSTKCPFYIKSSSIPKRFGNKIRIKDLEVDEKGRLYHQVEQLGNENRKVKVLMSNTLEEYTGYSVRWLNHLWFKDAEGNLVNFKKHITTTFDCKFT